MKLAEIRCFSFGRQYYTLKLKWAIWPKKTGQVTCHRLTTLKWSRGQVTTLGGQFNWSKWPGKTVEWPLWVVILWQVTWPCKEVEWLVRVVSFPGHVAKQNGRVTTLAGRFVHSIRILSPPIRAGILRAMVHILLNYIGPASTCQAATTIPLKHDTVNIVIQWKYAGLPLSWFNQC